MSILYDIFARKEHPEPLLYIGSVEVDHPADINIAGLEKYGPEGVSNLTMRSRGLQKFMRHELMEIIDTYKAKLKALT